MKEQLELLALLYAPCKYIIYILHCAYFAELCLLIYAKYKKVKLSNFIYYAYQNDMSMRNFVAMRGVIWAVLLLLDSSEQMQRTVAYACEPGFATSVFLIASSLYCFKKILSSNKPLKYDSSAD